MEHGDEVKEMAELLQSWQSDPQEMKAAFLEFKKRIESKKDVSLSFKARPGVSFSLRAGVTGPGKENDRMFVFVDIIDDDPDNRWLSVCFYGKTIEDKDGLGDLIPGGMLGEDGYCFDLEENDDRTVNYLKERIDEAYENIQAMESNIEC